MAKTRINATTVTEQNRILYHVVLNGGASKLTGKTVYNARVDASAPYNLEMIAKLMAQGRFPYEEEDVIHVLSTFSKLAQNLLFAGYSINIGGLVTLRPSIRGAFAGPDADFDEGVNRLRVTASVGKVLRYATVGGQVMKTAVGHYPVLKWMMDAASGKVNALTSAGSGTLHGKNLDFDAEAEDEGLWLETASGTEACAVLEATDEKIAFRTEATFDADTEAKLVLKTRSGNASQLLVTRAELPITGKPAKA